MEFSQLVESNNARSAGRRRSKPWNKIASTALAGEIMFYKVFALAVALVSTPVLAQDYVVTVHGIVCSFCAQGVIKKVSKLPFVDRSMYTNGVKVEIEEQKVTVAVRDDAAINTASLFAAIESGGYSPIDVWIVSATGELTAHPR